MPKTHHLIAGAATAAALAGLLALVFPIGAVGFGAVSAGLAIVALVQLNAPSREVLLNAVINNIEHGRRNLIYEPENLVLAYWYLSLRAEEECSRARRYGRELSVVVVQPVAELNDWAGQRWLADWLHRHTRETDLTGHAGNGKFVTLLTETPASGSQRFVERLATSKVPVLVGQSSFPEDGVTLNELVATAQTRMMSIGGARSQAAA